MAQYPDISYTHILSELSVNRKDPCEVIRELISNSYDAEASRIEIYPLLQYKGFIYFDNGTGMSETKEINEITPYRAFFSIGKSTKILGDAIGYKCQGSKLCFASSKFTLITRCQGEEHWRSISIDNPKDRLTPHYNIQSHPDSNPWLTLKNLFNKADKRTVTILNNLNEDFFIDKFNHGSMIVVQGFDVKDFSDYFGPKKIKGKDYYYLREYIRFNTRHGDMRILRSNETGFPPNKNLIFQKSPSYNERCELYLWVDQQLKKIEAGYPYLDEPNMLEKFLIKTPFNVSKLRSGNFYARGAATFEFEDRTYCLSLAIDGNNRALNKYEELDRQGSSGKRSGIRLTDQRGAFVCSEGVKICQYNEIFEHSKLIDDYGVLGSAKGLIHYIFMINGSFEVVTNRNSLTDAALTILKDDSFIENIKQFFDKARQHLTVFYELVERLNKEDDKYKIDAYISQRDKVKNEIQDRTRFMVKDIEQLNKKWLVAPSIGEEHWVGALYTMFAHLVPPESQYADLWMRPRTFSGVGIDSLAVNIAENSLAPNVHKGLEYKWTFSASEWFNHPFIVTDQIVCWEMETPEDGKQVEDSYNYYGYTFCPQELDGLGYEIIKIQERSSGDSYRGTIKVISLKNLIDKTFKCEWETPPPKVTDSQKGKRTKKLKS